MERENRSVTLDDIAQHLNISKATVSNALSGNRHVSPKTIERVQTACKDLGYEVNGIARGLRTQKTNLIGVIVPNINEPFQGIVVRYVEEELRKRGLEMLLGSYYFDLDEELHLLKTFRNLMVDGLIAISGLDDNTPAYKEISAKVPTVFLSRHALGEQIASVSQDALSIAVDVVKYLSLKGHRRIAHLTIPHSNFRKLKLEVEGFEKARCELGLDTDPDLLISESSIMLHEVERSIQAAHRVLNTGATAVYAVSDYIGIGLLKGLTSLGIHVPNDISIIGVGNVDYGLITTPTLTSVDIGAKQIACEGVRLLTNLKPSSWQEEYCILVEHKLIERESVASLVK